MRRKTRLAERKTENGRPVWDGHLIRAVKCGAACLPAGIQPGRTHEIALLFHAGALAAAAAAVAAAAIPAAATAAADQQDEDNDPAAVPAKETVIAHTGTSYGVVGRGAGPTS